jgi:hypothetical protein
MVLACVALSYVAMNVLVGTHLFRDAIGADPGSLLVEYRRAYSLFPGRVHVEGLSIRGRDSSVEWALSIDRCDFTVSLVDLLRRRFHASHVKGDGLALLVRIRKDSVSAEAMSATPRIAGFLDPPLSDVGPPLAPLADADYHLWSVFLDGIEASHVRELWIDTVRYSGDLTVRGSWFFRPLRWLEVGPATVELHPLEVSFGEVEPWAQGVTGAIDVKVHPTDLVSTRGAGVAGQLSVHGDASGDLQLASLLNRLLPETTTAPVTARFNARIGIDHGAILPPTDLALDPFRATVEADGRSFTATLGVEVVAHDRGLASTLVTGTDVRIASGRSLLATAPRVSVRADTRIVDLAHVPPRPFGLHAVAVNVPAVDLPSLAGLTALVRLPAGLSVEGGRGHGSVTLDLDTAGESGAARADIEARSIRAHFEGEAIAGDARLVLRAAARGGAMDVSGTSLMFHTDGDVAAAQWWGGVELTEATLRGVGAPHLRARVSLHAKDASPLAALLASKTSIPKFLLNAVSTSDLQATGDILATPSLVEARAVQVHCDGLDSRFEYVLQGSAAAWALWLDFGLARVSAYQENGSNEITLFDTEPWFAQRVARIRTVERVAN